MEQEKSLEEQVDELLAQYIDPEKSVLWLQLSRKYYERAEAADRQDRPALTAKAMEAAIVSSLHRPDDPEPVFMRGKIFLFLERYFRPALAMFNEAVEKNPTNWDYHFHLGFAQQELGLIDKAFDSYKNAMAVAGTDNQALASVHFGFAMAHARYGDLEQATNYMESSIAKGYDESKVKKGVTARLWEYTNKLSTGKVYDNQDDAKAIAAYQLMQSIYDERSATEDFNEVALVNRVKLTFKLGQVSGDEILVRKALQESKGLLDRLEQRTHIGRLHKLLSSIYSNLGDKSGSEYHFEEYSKIFE